MVILTCLSLILKELSNLLEHIVAVHIEHSNRIISKDERDFLIKYCKYLNIPIYYRTIDYMSRDTPYLDRNIYEEESKKLRFNLYKYICEYDKENLSGICIGHHMGDITENVFTNIIKGKFTNDLGQMKMFDTQNDVNIYRPLLNLTKDDIYSFAHKFNIPYFKNSTPPWSCRGVIRDKMIPILKSQFGSFESNIINFMNSYKETSELNDKYIIKPYLDSILKLTYGYKIPFISDMMLNSIWEKILLNITHSNGYNMISIKSKNNLMIWLKNLVRAQKSSTLPETEENKIENPIIPNAYELNKLYTAIYFNNYIYLIDYSKLKDSEIIKVYKQTLVRAQKSSTLPETEDDKQTLDDLLSNNINKIKVKVKDITLDDLLSNNINKILMSDTFVDKKLIKIPQKIKQLLF